MYALLALLFGGLAVGTSVAGGSGGAARDADSSDDTAPPSADTNVDNTTPAPAPAPTPAPAPPAPVADAPNTPPSAPADETPSTPDLPASAYDIGWAGLSAEEQLIVELINRARFDPDAEVDRLNDDLSDDSSSASVQALAVVKTLSDAAEAHSEDMDDRNFFSHTDPDGGLPWDRAADAGHSTTFVGENIGWIGSTNPNFNAQVRAEAHHANLWSSDGHQENLLGSAWSEIGLGYDYGSHQGYNGSTFVTELFSDTGKTYLTGVVIDDKDSDEFYDIGEGQGDVRITAVDADDNVYTTSTWDAGGYSLALPAGSYRVMFEGGDLDKPYETNVTIGGENVKLDVIDQAGNAVITLNAGVPEPASSDVAALIFDDTEPADMPVPEPEPEIDALAWL